MVTELHENIYNISMLVWNSCALLVTIDDAQANYNNQTETELKAKAAEECRQNTQHTKEFGDRKTTSYAQKIVWEIYDHL